MNTKQLNKFISKKHIVFDYSMQIYTTGAHLSPLKVTDSEGKVFWVWHVTEFDNDSFKDGELFNPKESAINRDDLLKIV